MDRKVDVGSGALARALERVHPGQDFRRVVRDLATDLHHQYLVTGPPFSPWHFAERLGIPVVHADIEAEGVLTSDAAFVRIIEEEDDDVLRTIKADEGLSALRRQNFTLAHEIGHYVIRREVSSCLSVFRRDDPVEEMLCNTFASELLMPRMSLWRDLKRCGISPRALLYLCNRYEVSLQALLCRVTDIFRGEVKAILWAQSEGGRLVISFAAPKQLRRAILCETGATPIENAFRTLDPEIGRCDFLLDGERTRWYTVALRLTDSSKVLSVMHRSIGELDRFLPMRPDLVFRCSRRQLKLPFDAGEPQPAESVGFRSSTARLRLPRKSVQGTAFKRRPLAIAG